MKIGRSFAAMFLLFVLSFGAPAQKRVPSVPSGPTPMTLQRAVSTGRVSAQISGTGASSGDSIKLKIRKRGGGDLDISVPPGTMLRNASGGEQDMVVAGVRGIDLGGGRMRPASSVHLSGTRAETVVLAAFCAEFEKDNPSSTASFSVRAPDPKLACVMRKSAGLALSARQAAVWMLTDGISYSHMRQKFPVTSSEWSQGEAVVKACDGGSR